MAKVDPIELATLEYEHTEDIALTQLRRVGDESILRRAVEVLAAKLFGGGLVHMTRIEEAAFGRTRYMFRLPYMPKNRFDASLAALARDMAIAQARIEGLKACLDTVRLEHSCSVSVVAGRHLKRVIRRIEQAIREDEAELAKMQPKDTPPDHPLASVSGV